MKAMDWVGKRLSELESEFPDHDVWYVRFTGVRSGVWCARPKGWPVATVNADSVDGLRKALLGEEPPQEPVTGQLFYVNFPGPRSGQLQCDEDHPLGF